MDGDGLRIAGEDLVHHRAIRLFREQTDNRHHNESDKHGEHPGVDRGGKGRVDKWYACQSADEVRRHAAKWFFTIRLPIAAPTNDATITPATNAADTQDCKSSDAAKILSWRPSETI